MNDLIETLKIKMREEEFTMLKHSNSSHSTDIKKYYEANGARRAYEKTLSSLLLNHKHKYMK